MIIHSYKDLIVWQKAVDLAVKIYEMTERFPKSELYGLTSQMRRAAVSIASNIAEGRSRVSKKNFAQFLTIAHGSISELETQIEISKRVLGMLEVNFLQIENSISEIKAILGVMIRKLNPLPL